MAHATEAVAALPQSAAAKIDEQGHREKDYKGDYR